MSAPARLDDGAVSVDVAVEPAAPVPLAARQVDLSLGIAILAVIAVVAALYLARAFFVPLLIGILTSYALRPVVNAMTVLRIPRAAGAALALGVFVASAAWVTFALGDDAASVVGKLPDAARKMRRQVISAQEQGPTALQKIQEAATELQGAASDAAGDKSHLGKAQPGSLSRIPCPASGCATTCSPSPRSSLTVAAQAPIVLLLAYFLLASGEHFRRKLIQLVGPSLTRKKDAVRILEEIDTQIQRYMLVTLGTNVLIAVGTWLAFEALGVENAGVWGIGAGVLHFIPYLGSVIFAVASGVVGFMQFGSALGGLTVAGVSLLVAAAGGALLATWFQSRVSRVNAAVLFIALLFFGWLWGVWGLLLGAPLVAIAKVICDRVDVLNPAGELLGR